MLAGLAWVVVVPCALEAGAYHTYEHSVLRRKADGQLIDPTLCIGGNSPFLPDPLLDFTTRYTLVKDTTLALHVYCITRGLRPSSVTRS